MKTSIQPNDAPSISPDVLHEEAVIWLGRLTDGGVTQPELQAFKRWQQTSPAHAAAFEDAKYQWKAMRPALVEMLRANPARSARHARLSRAPQMGRRAFLGAGVGAAAAAGVAILHPPLGLWPPMAEWGADYRTGTGEQRIVALSDSVTVTLNTQTSIRRQAVDGGVVGMHILAGEAAVDLGSGSGPFAVVAGVGTSLVESGRFEARYLGDKVCVTCIDGAVRIMHPSGSRRLQARQQTVYDDSGISNVAAVETGSVSAWRKGELVFNQTPLAQVIDEINRYRPGRVVLMSASGRDRGVVGRFRIAVLDEALLQIQLAFGLDARRLPGGLLVLS
ncbi:DUF4880 domain-containing protein [Cupriavidus basilensis]|uniref:DUF4880 domain-containing protein n=1 Tax=Cupriavidus basilensis TaxID=68895 RepID=A0ABT6B3V9_9BURK|nr:FecR domain-containing protein [Cupriavidus basilensis]MDF3839172.1 DUF4880 domain-containing protein [Cupriavidus basilensis]